MRTPNIGDVVNCHRCGAGVALINKRRVDAYHHSTRAFCSATCRDVTVSEESAARMRVTNLKYAAAASVRMTARNPMRHASAREKMRTTLRAIGHKPKVRGGNGRPLPIQQQRLALALGWPCEVAVATGLRGKTPDRYPTCYKLDIANVDLKIGVEIDGPCHASRRALDQKKDRFFEQRGWRVLRFANADVEKDLARCEEVVYVAAAAAAGRMLP